MKGTVTDRFEIEESSWSWELSSAIVDFLKMIPAEDDTIDIEKIIFDGLSDRVLFGCKRLRCSSAIIGVFCPELTWIWRLNTYLL